MTEKGRPSFHVAHVVTLCLLLQNVVHPKSDVGEGHQQANRFVSYARVCIGTCVFLSDGSAVPEQNVKIVRSRRASNRAR